MECHIIEINRLIVRPAAAAMAIPAGTGSSEIRNIATTSRPTSCFR